MKSREIKLVFSLFIMPSLLFASTINNSNPMFLNTMNSLEDKVMLHDLRRLTYGPTHESILEYKSLGRDNWIDKQLEEITLAEDTAQSMRENTLVYRSKHTMQHSVMRPLHSVHQLRAKLSYFWNNHFYTSVNGTNSAIEELIEEDTFFLKAFGNFEDLLLTSAKSPMMIKYLDTFRSHKNKPNENYARELMELHTLGRDNGYSAEDISELARIFTGWGLTRDRSAQRPYNYKRAQDNERFQGVLKFRFNPPKHDTGEDKNFLGHTITSKSGGSGIEEGEEALSILANHPNTIDFICYKLSKYLVSNTPNNTTLNECTTTFTANQNNTNQIKEVVKTLINTDQYLSLKKDKLKDNLESLIALARLANLDANVSRGYAHSVGYQINYSGQGPFKKNAPTGYSDDNDFWLEDKNAMQKKFYVAEKFIFHKRYRYYKGDWKNYFKNLNITTPNEIVEHLSQIMFGESRLFFIHYYWVNELEKGPNNFSLNNSDAEKKLKYLITRMFHYTKSQFH